MENSNRITGAAQLRLQHELQIRQDSHKGSSDFASILRKELEEKGKVQFSKHAAERISQRGIEMSDGLMEDLNAAIAKAREKGARDVVVIGSQGAFIVNVPNNVVVTTVARDEMKDNIFTNIDSAVLL